jgi:hypothetical protein
LMINTSSITKCLYQVHFTPDQNRPESGFGFVMWLLWDRFILQIAPFLHRLKWLLNNVLQIFYFFCEFLTYFGNYNSDFNSYPDSMEYPGVGCFCSNGSKWYCQCLFK